MFVFFHSFFFSSFHSYRLTNLFALLIGPLFRRPMRNRRPVVEDEDTIRRFINDEIRMMQVVRDDEEDLLAR